VAATAFQGTFRSGDGLIGGLQSSAESVASKKYLGAHSVPDRALTASATGEAAIDGPLRRRTSVLTHLVFRHSQLCFGRDLITPAACAVAGQSLIAHKTIARAKPMSESDAMVPPPVCRLHALIECAAQELASKSHSLILMSAQEPCFLKAIETNAKIESWLLATQLETGCDQLFNCVEFAETQLQSNLIAGSSQCISVSLYDLIRIAGGKAKLKAYEVGIQSLALRSRLNKCATPSRDSGLDNEGRNATGPP
jgi:hypothetical protein